MNTAIARARTQSGAKFCITVVIKDMIAVHAAPPNKMATDRSTTDLNPATPQSDAAKTVVPSASSASDENNERVRCSARSEEHTSELQSRLHLVCRLLLEKKKHRVHILIKNAKLNSLQLNPAKYPLIGLYNLLVFNEAFYKEFTSPRIYHYPMGLVILEHL